MSFYEAKIWRVVKRRMPKRDIIDFGENPGRLLSTIGSGLNFREARKLKRELNQNRNPYEKRAYYYCMERTDK